MHLRRAYYPTGQKKCSPKSLCRTVQRAPVLRRSWPLLTLRAQTSDHYMLRVCIKKRSGQYAAPRQDADTGEGYQELRPRVLYGRYGVPDMDVCTRRFKGRRIWSGPQGPRDHVRRLQRPLRRLGRAVQHVAEGQENNRGTPQGCSRGGDGVIKISQSLNLVIAADLRRPSHRPHCARRTRSKFAFLWPRSG